MFFIKNNALMFYLLNNGVCSIYRTFQGERECGTDRRPAPAFASDDEHAYILSGKKRIQPLPHASAQMFIAEEPGRG
jgi:hypothetical protein